jgi:hypothetical protein
VSGEVDPQGNPDRDEQRDDDRKADEQTTHGKPPSFSEVVQLRSADAAAFSARVAPGQRFPAASQRENSGKQGCRKSYVRY